MFILRLTLTCLTPEVNTIRHSLGDLQNKLKELDLLKNMGQQEVWLIAAKETLNLQNG